MIDERKEEFASLYVLDALPAEEKAAFEAELARDPELRHLVDELRQTAAGLAFTAPAATPSAKLRERVLASAARQGGQISRDEKIPQRPAGAGKLILFPSWIGWTAAACFALLAGYTSLRYVTTRGELAIEREQAQLSAVEMKSTQQSLEAERILSGRQVADLKKTAEDAVQQIAQLQREADVAQLKIARLASLNQNSPEAVAIAVWNPLKQEGVLTVESLPRIRQDQDYQLWVIDPRYKTPVSGGVFQLDERGAARVNFRPDQPVTAATQFAISRERKGGVPRPEGPIVAAGAF